MNCHIKCSKCRQLFYWISKPDEIVVNKETPNAVRKLIECQNPECQAKLIIWVENSPYKKNKKVKEIKNSSESYPPSNNPRKPPKHPYDPPTYHPPTTFPSGGVGRKF